MSKEIDERIVEMRFDNKQFESATKETMTTLEKLKNALNLNTAAKSFDAVEKASGKVKFSKMQESLAALEKRFSTFGIFTARIIENAADTVYKTVTTKIGGAISYITNAVKEGGMKRAMNLENAHFQLQALLKDEVKVQEVLANASASVDGTAYSLDEAAVAASQFAASGIQAGDDMVGALRGIVGVSAMTNREFGEISRIFTTVAGNGRLMGDQLLQLSDRGLNAASTLADFFNGVNDGSKQASDSVTAAVRTLTGGLKVSETDVREWVSKGKINFKMFSEAMTEAFADSAERANETYTGALSNMRAAFARIGEGFYKPLIAQNSEVVKLINSVRVRINDVKNALVFNEELDNVNALSKQWTDFVLSLATYAAKWVDNVDLSKPLAAFYYGVESVKNIGKGLLQILDAIGVAFKNVFHDYLRMDNVVDAMAKLEELTSHFKLTSKGAANVRRTFRGIFDIIKLLIEGFTDFIKAIIPCENSAEGLGDTVLGLTGDLGALLSRFAEWVRESKTLNKIFDILTTSIRKTIEFVLNINKHVKNLITTLRGIPEVNKFIEAMSNLFEGLGKKASPYISDIREGLKDFISNMSNWDLSVSLGWLDALSEKIQALADILMADDGIKTASENAKSYMDRLKEAFSFDNLIAKFEGFQKVVGTISKWVEEKFAPVFEGFTFSSALATAGGGGLIYALVKLSKAFEGISKTIGSLKEIPRFFKEINNTLQSYQKDLNATALLKTAGAIAILTLCIIGLSFIDTSKLMGAAMAIGIVAGVLLYETSKLIEATNKGKGVEGALKTLANGLDAGIKKIATGIKWKMILEGVKEFGKAVAFIGGTIIAIALMYRKDPAATETATTMVSGICIFLIGVVALFSALGEHLDKGMKNFQKAGIGILALAAAVKLVVSSVSDLFGMYIPKNAWERLAMLAVIFLALGAMSYILSDAGKQAGGKKFQTSALIGVAASVYVVVMALDKLFKMQIPSDAGIKLAILGGIFLSLAIMMLLIEKAAGKGSTTIKAAGTILAMCLFVGVVVAALMILSIVPFNRLISGAVSLGIVLVSLGAALYGASKVSDEKTAKTVFNMAVVVGVIAGSLAILSLIKWPALLKACTALGSMLLIVAVDFLAVSKISNKEVHKTVFAMAAVIVAIAASLFILALQDWEKLLAAAGAMSAVLLSFGATMILLGQSKGISTEKLKNFLGASLILAPITAALWVLGDKDWKRLLAAGAAISLVLFTFGNVMETISRKTGIKKEKIDAFLECSLVLIPITGALWVLADSPWEGLLAAGVALSLTVAALGVAFNLIAGQKTDVETIGLFLLSTAALIPIGVALGVLSNQNWEGMLPIAESMSLLLIALAAVFAILVMIGPAASGALVAIGVFDLFLASFALILLALGALLENETTKRLLNGGMEVMAKLGTAIGDFVGNIIAGIGRGIGEALAGIGEGLSKFWEDAEPFFDGVSNIDSSCLDGIKTIAQAVLILSAADFINGITSIIGMKTTTLEDFGNQLAAMAPSIKEYADTVDGINPTAVAASGLAVKIMAEAASILPRQADWYDKIFGTKQTLKEFGEELEEFAPAIKGYADEVDGINTDAVEASATAAQCLAELATKLPRRDGKLQEWFGQQVDLETFGNEMKAFGKSLVDYSKTVSEEGAVNKDAIEYSANAAQIMVDLAKDLPNTGGVVGFFAGNNDLDDFGDRLVSFGKSLCDYSKAVSAEGAIDQNAIQNSANATQSLVDLSNSLENSGGFISIWTGDNTLDEFGEQLVSFGDSLATYYSNIKGIRDVHMGNVTTELVRLGEAVQGLPEEANMTAFVDDLTQAGMNGVNGFLNAFKGSTVNMMVVITAWGKSVLSSFKNAMPAKNFTSLATELIGAFTAGINNSQAAVKIVLTTFCLSLVSTARNSLPSSSFQTIAASLMAGFTTGIATGRTPAIAAVSGFATTVKQTLTQNIQNQDYSSLGVQIVNKLSSGLVSARGRIQEAANQIRNDIYNAFRDLGEYAAEGLAKGLKNKQNTVTDAASNLAKIATDAARRKLEVRSPSRVWMAIGEFLSEGLSIGILENMALVARAGEEIADTATDPISAAVDVINGIIQDDLGNGIEITPTLNLSEIQRGAEELSKMLNTNSGLSATYEKTLQAAGDFSRMKKAVENNQITSAETDSEGRNTFIQNNYSPKALSAIDIYRQTQNQFRMFERMVKA